MKKRVLLCILLSLSVLLSGCTTNSVKQTKKDDADTALQIFAEDHSNICEVIFSGDSNNRLINRIMENEESDTIRINYQDNKELLEILKLIPDKSMGSWEWSEADRTEMVEYVKTYNYFVDTDKTYNNIIDIKPNFLKIQVVDGSWIMSIYRIGIEHFIVITDDIVGDGNDLFFYEVKSGELTEIEKTSFENSMISDFLLDKNNNECMELIKDNLSLFDYNFENEEKIIVKSFFTEDEHCLKGKELIYRFKQEKKTFELESIRW
jgi:hypothetical protein